MKGLRLIPIYEKGDLSKTIGTIPENELDHPVFYLTVPGEVESYEILKDDAGDIIRIEVVLRNKSTRLIPLGKPNK